MCVGALYLRDNDEHLGDLLGVRGRYTPPTLPFARGRLSDDARRLRPLCAKEREREEGEGEIFTRGLRTSHVRGEERSSTRDTRINHVIDCARGHWPLFDAVTAF